MPTTTQDTAQRIARARVTKAQAIAAWILQETPQTIALDRRMHLAAVRSMPREWWDSVASHAGQNVPSDETIAIVLGLLERPEYQGDVLAGLPRD